MTESQRKHIGQRIRAVREKQGLTQHEASDLAGGRPAQNYWSELEQGKHCPGLDMLERIAGALGVTVAKLLRGT